MKKKSNSFEAQLEHRWYKLYLRNHLYYYSQNESPVRQRILFFDLQTTVVALLFACAVAASFGAAFGILATAVQWSLAYIVVAVMCSVATNLPLLTIQNAIRRWLVYASALRFIKQIDELETPNRLATKTGYVLELTKGKLQDIESALADAKVEGENLVLSEHSVALARLEDRFAVLASEARTLPAVGPYDVLQYTMDRLDELQAFQEEITS